MNHFHCPHPPPRRALMTYCALRDAEVGKTGTFLLCHACAERVLRVIHAMMEEAPAEEGGE